MADRATTLDEMIKIARLAREDGATVIDVIERLVIERSIVVCGTQRKACLLLHMPKSTFNDRVLSYAKPGGA